MVHQPKKAFGSIDIVARKILAELFSKKRFYFTQAFGTKAGLGGKYAGIVFSQKLTAAEIGGDHGLLDNPMRFVTRPLRDRFDKPLFIQCPIEIGLIVGDKVMLLSIFAAHSGTVIKRFNTAFNCIAALAKLLLVTVKPRGDLLVGKLLMRLNFGQREFVAR